MEIPDINLLAIDLYLIEYALEFYDYYVFNLLVIDLRKIVYWNKVFFVELYRINNCQVMICNAKRDIKTYPGYEFLVSVDKVKYNLFHD